jgi:murein DD-endopeptidase MepM/ murein hydrolase activator NlpD
MYHLKCPVTHTVWGAIKSLADMERAIIKSGQPFGVDWSGPADETIPGAPHDKTYYQYLGFGLHSGIDLPVSAGTEIYASTDGTVCEISDKITNGLGVVIYDSTQKIKTLFWHLKSYNVVLGQEVKAGDLIGLSDNTGYSKGNHLHFALKETDEHGISIKAIDPMPYFVFNKTMTEKEVKLLYVLAFYREPDVSELAYWTGKSLEAMLRQAIDDRSKFLAKELQ